MRRVLAAVALLAIIASNVALQRWYSAIFTHVEKEQTAVSVVLDALGEIRTFLAHTIYFQTDIYHHEMEAQGITWDQEKDLMSMYKMVTTLDPHLVEAYDVAAYQLVEHFHREDMGLQYLEEGITNNPNSALLWAEKAFLLQRMALKLAPQPKDGKPRTAPLPPKAVEYFEGSIKAAARARELIARLPEILLQTDDPQDQIPYLNQVRIQAQDYKELGNREAEASARKIMLMLRPDDVVSAQRLVILGYKPVGYTPQEFLKLINQPDAAPTLEPLSPSTSPSASPGAPTLN